MSRRLWIVCGVLAVSLGLRLWLSATPAIPLRAPLAQFPTILGQWTMTASHTIEEQSLNVLRADDYLLRSYRDLEGNVADLYIGYYENQHTGETMHSPKNCLPGWGWLAVESGRITLGPAPGGRGTVINRYVIEKDNERALVLYWYQAHGRIIASEYWGKIYLVWDSLARHRRDGALVRIVIPVQTDARQSEARSLEFAELLLRELPRHLPD